jgi:hypothetical protein
VEKLKIIILSMIVIFVSNFRLFEDDGDPGEIDSLRGEEQQKGTDLVYTDDAPKVLETWTRLEIWLVYPPI